MSTTGRTRCWQPSSDPPTETWRTLASGAVPRLYHSIAILLPDGRVALGGGGHPPGFGVDEYRSELYSPPYLFKGARPTITLDPVPVEVRAVLLRRDAGRREITKAALIPQPAVTHAKNAASVYIPLTFSQTSDGLTVNAPPNGNLAARDVHVFLVNGNGVPSVATWITISAPGGGGSLSSLSFESASKQRVLSSRNDQAPVTPPAPSTLSIFGGAPIGAPRPSSRPPGSGSHPKRLVCKVDAGRREVQVPAEPYGPP